MVRDVGLFARFGGGDDALSRYVDHFDELPLLLPLGFAPSYSNPGTSLEGRVLEAVAGQSYEATIRTELLEPLGMERATFFADEAIRYATAAGHTPVEGKPVVQNIWAVPRTVGSAVASDAFFPFADGLLAAVEAGATCVIQPGGSIRDDEVIAAANKAGLAMVFTGMRHFRH